MLQIGQNIKLIRGLAGKTQLEFAILISENLSNLKTYETKDVMPKLHIQHRLAKMAGVSVEDLINKALTPDDINLNLDVEKVKKVNRTAQGGQILNDTGNGEENYIQKRRALKGISAPYMVPVVPVKAQAGYARAYSTSDFINQLEMRPILSNTDHRGLEWRFFEVQGDSMEPALFETDLVLVSLIPYADWQDIKDKQVCVIVTNEDVFIKQVYRFDNETWILKSVNKRRGEKRVKVSEIKEVWRYRRHETSKINLPK